MSNPIELRLAAIEARLAALESGGGARSSSGKTGQVASDKVFQGQYGNFEVTIDPKAWDGESMKGRRVSECPIEWLELAAEMYDAFGVKAEETGKTDKNGKPVAWRDHQRSALCRRWAIELKKESDRKPAPATQSSEPAWNDDDGDGLPF